MILRPRQRVFVDRCLAALREHGNTLGVAPTGAGKTVMLSAIGGELGGHCLVLQHREELVKQNRRTWVRVNTEDRNRTTVYARWAKHWRTRDAGLASATFAMVPTLSRPAHLRTMPAVDLVIVDEAHHSTARTYRRIVREAKKLNPDVRVLGVTATPNRGDGTKLSKVFTNLADQISIGEVIASGHLVPPRAFVLDVGVSEGLASLSGKSETELVDAAAELLDVEVVTSKVVEHWREHAGDRQTIVYTGTCAHAEHVAGAFVDASVKAGMLTGETPKGERAKLLEQLESGDLQVIVNVGVLTEGWDCPPVSCVVLLRPSSYHSTMIQMIGRGLRTLDPERFPGQAKTDCVVLDFGRSLLTHGGIEQVVDLQPSVEQEPGGEAPKKVCSECGAEVGLATRQCPLCGYQWPAELHEVTTLEEFQMVELDLLMQSSPFLWWAYNSRTRVVTAFDVWAVAFESSGAWHAFGGQNGTIQYLAAGTERVAVGAGDDWMRQHGDPSCAGKNRAWLRYAPTDKQMRVISRFSTCPPVTNRYEAACALTLRFNRARIQAAWKARKVAA